MDLARDRNSFDSSQLKLVETLQQLKRVETLQQLKNLETSNWYLEQMRTRRSVRQFTNDSVPDEVILNAVKAAASAPSGANRQPWHFSIIKSPELKKKIRTSAEVIEDQFYNGPRNKDWIADLNFLNVCETKPFLETNSHLIVVSVKTKVDPLEVDFCTNRAYYPKESTSIAIGFLLSSLHLAGVSTLTHTPRPADFLIDLLQLDPETKPLMIVVAGRAHPEYLPPQIKKRSLEDISTTFL